MTSTRKYVKLCFQIYNSERIVVDKWEADQWDDFLIVRIKGMNNHTEMYGVYETMQKAIAEAAPNKQIILVPDGLDIEFYGIEVEESDGNP